MLKHFRIVCKFQNPYPVEIEKITRGGEVAVAVKRGIQAAKDDPRSWKGKRSVKRWIFEVDDLGPVDVFREKEEVPVDEQAKF